MLINNAFFAAALAFASVGTVAGEWLKTSPGNSWTDYCTGHGSKYNSLRLCFKASPAVLKRIQNTPSFQGFLAPDGAGFVVIDNGQDAQVVTETHTIKIHFGSFVGSPDSVNQCSTISIWTNKVPTTLGVQTGVCNGDYYTLPDDI